MGNTIIEVRHGSDSCWREKKIVEQTNGLLLSEAASWAQYTKQQQPDIASNIFVHLIFCPLLYGVVLLIYSASISPYPSPPHPLRTWNANTNLIFIEKLEFLQLNGLIELHFRHMLYTNANCLCIFLPLNCIIGSA